MQYALVPCFSERFKKVGRKLEMKATTLKDYAGWQGRARERLKDLIGHNECIPAEPTPVTSAP
jgi:hypothetical protein